MSDWTKKSSGFPKKTEETGGAAEPDTPNGTEAPSTAADQGDEPAEPASPDEVAMPEGWSTKRRSAPKRWSDAARSDSAEKRVVDPPQASGVGDGRSVLFLFGLKIHSPRDQQFLAQIREHIDDDVEVLCQAGFTVAVDEQATHKDFLDAVYGQGEGVAGLRPAAIFWNAHGLADGSVETCDGGVVRPEDIETDKVSPDLKLLVFASCYVGNRSRTWRKAMGGRPLVVGWGRPVTVDRAVEFLTPDEQSETDLDDLIRRYLIADLPVPGPVSLSYSPMAELSAAGYSGDLPERMSAVIEMLGGQWKEEKGWIWVDVPLGDGRRQRAKVFVIDSTAPFSEGEPLLAVESDIGEITRVVDPSMLLAGVFGSDYARIALVQSETDMPRMMAQGFLPLARVRNQDLAAVIFHVCRAADVVERRVFGTDLT